MRRLVKDATERSNRAVRLKGTGAPTTWSLSLRSDGAKPTSMMATGSEEGRPWGTNRAELAPARGGVRERLGVWSWHS